MNNNYTFRKANINDINEIFNIYFARETFLKLKKINQWINYTRHYTRELMLKNIQNEKFI